jgi:hypothetical protein
MVPMLTLTSMLLEPSSGSNSSRYSPLRVAVGHHVDAVHLLAGHGGQVAAPFVGLDQHLVGDDVELLLDLALHVLALGAAQHAAQRALVDGVADALAGARDHFQQQAQLRRGCGRRRAAVRPGSG